MSETLQEFYERHKDFAFSYILYVFGGNQREACRVLKQVFIEFFEEAESNSKNMTDDYLKSLLRRRTRTYEKKYRKEIQAKPPAATYNTRLLETVGGLPQLQQDCIIFKYLYRLTPKQISKILDKTEMSIRQNISRGTKKILTEMEDNTHTSRTFQLPLAQVPARIDQIIKLKFRQPQFSFGDWGMFYKKLKDPWTTFCHQIARMTHSKWVILGILILGVTSVLKVPDIVYSSDLVGPKNPLYTWKRSMENTRLASFQNPANRSRYYLVLSNRRIKEAYGLSRTPSLISLVWQESFANTDFVLQNSTTLTPKNNLVAGLLAEGSYYLGQSILEVNLIESPHTSFSILKEIDSNLKQHQILVRHIKNISSAPELVETSTNIQTIQTQQLSTISTNQALITDSIATGKTPQLVAAQTMKVVFSGNPGKNKIIKETLEKHNKMRADAPPYTETGNYEAIESFKEIVLDVRIPISEVELTPLPIAPSSGTSVLMESKPPVPNVPTETNEKTTTEEARSKLNDQFTDPLEEVISDPSEPIEEASPLVPETENIIPVIDIPKSENPSAIDAEVENLENTFEALQDAKQDIPPIITDSPETDSQIIEEPIAPETIAEEISPPAVEETANTELIESTEPETVIPAETIAPLSTQEETAPPATPDTTEELIESTEPVAPPTTTTPPPTPVVEIPKPETETEIKTENNTEPNVLEETPPSEITPDTENEIPSEEAATPKPTSLQPEKVKAMEQLFGSKAEKKPDPTGIPIETTITEKEIQ